MTSSLWSLPLFKIFKNRICVNAQSFNYHHLPILFLSSLSQNSSVLVLQLYLQASARLLFAPRKEGKMSTIFSFPVFYFVRQHLMRGHSFVSHSVSDAKAYVDFILNSIRKKDLFHSIEIKPESCWEYLLWMDQVKNSWSVHHYLQSISSIDTWLTSPLIESVNIHQSKLSNC